ncbi:MAG: M23 family metallopeptidase, partial [Candidatus Rokubacteria bacterium]|nr:M23 family metallopeptidase [Candidatus Rokubacteria bacterium]
PILGRWRAHLGTDYAAAYGTPVRATADGIVAVAGRESGYGNLVELRHAKGITTRYGHLSGFARGIRAGVRVRQRETVGFVGATGLATGPHLDYRVSKHGRFVNPLGERFIPGEPIAVAERARFLEHARVSLRRLEDQAPF